MSVDLPAPAVDFADALFNDVAELVEATVNLLDRLEDLRGLVRSMSWNENEEHFQTLRDATHVGQAERLFQIVARLIGSTPMGHDSADGLPAHLDGSEALRIRREAREEVGHDAPFSWGWSGGASGWSDVVESPWPVRVDQ